MLPVVGYNRFPDEKGTESDNNDLISYLVPMSYNRFPDEKGTERSHTLRRGCALRGYNRFPDEKGTESSNAMTVASSDTRLQSFPR